MVCINMPKKKPVVYLDISIGGRTGGRVEFELFNDVTPTTAENFRGLCTGEYGIGRQTKKNLCYDGCKVFRVKKGAYIQSGDIVSNNGDGGESVYGGTLTCKIKVSNSILIRTFQNGPKQRAHLKTYFQSVFERFSAHFESFSFLFCVFSASSSIE